MIKRSSTMESTSHDNICILGYGNMGKALYKYLLLCGVKQNNIRLTCKSIENANSINKAFNAKITYICNKNAVSLCNYVFICVKPDIVETVCKEIADYLPPKCVVISLAASVEILKLEKWLTRIDLYKLKIFRSMPLISISKDSGIFPLFSCKVDHPVLSKIKCESTSNQLLKLLNLNTCQVFEVNSEEELDQLTIFSACGLAYISKLLKCYYDAGNSLNMSKSLRNKVMVSTVKGLMDIFSEEDETFESINNKVSSKGGITEASLKFMDTDMIGKNIEKLFSIADSKLKSLRDLGKWTHN